MGDSEVKIGGYTSFTKKWHSSPSATISPSRPELSAAGKNIVITGGGTGIGKFIATAFAKAGASTISILGRRADRLITASKEISQAAANSKHSTKVLYRVTDITNKNDVDASFKSLAGEVGALHILVSNAGVFPDIGFLATTPIDAFMASFETNVRGALNAVQAFIPLSAPAPDSHEPTILSIATSTHVAPLPSLGNYMVSKAANHKMMDFIAAENPNVHVVNVCPGVIETEMSAVLADSVSHWDSREFFCFSSLFAVL
jgi:NAD(P)-dependent dehydrogenase (short-subunit alcohol dehydrogenase family)